jgi:6-phosphogluconolactonase (cycloisomerase 2 family)
MRAFAYKNVQWLAAGILAIAAAVSHAAPAAPATAGKSVVYAALGEELSRYELDASSATLTKMGSVKLPANVQFADFHPCRCLLYVVSSNAGNGTLGAAGDKHVLSAFRIARKTGALLPHGEPVILPERPIHVSVDRKGQNVLVAYNQSGTVRVYRLSADGYLGEEVSQRQRPDAGIFTHQVVVTPSNATVIALGRGNEAVGNKPADIGSVSTFRLHEGRLELLRKQTYDEGIGPRHLAFHPTRPWVYVGIERGSKLFTYELQRDGLMSVDPLFKIDTLLDHANEHRDRQKGGVVKIHPNGRYAYATNRADGTVKKDGKTYFAGGENNIAVLSLDRKTGEPTLIQHIESGGIEPRTFAIDASGTLLIAANQKASLVEDASGEKTIDANFAIFRIAGDGRLEFIRKYEVDAGQRWLLWMDVLDPQASNREVK